MSDALVSTARRDSVLLVTIDRPPVNALNAAVRTGLLAALEEVANDASITGVVLCGVGAQFIAGSDLSEFDGPIATPILPVVLDALDECRVPVVAALHGATLGGGFELVMTCDARIGTNDIVVGLPEVTLGILPGAGGTQRLPRLIGHTAALDLVTTGRRVKAAEALKLGIVDQLVEDRVDVVDAAVAFVTAMPARRRLRDAAVPDGDLAVDAAPSKGTPDENIVRAKELVLLAGTEPFDVTLKKERAAFDELRNSFTAKALRYAFFAERSVGDELRGADPRTIQSGGVIGAGTMGAGIATVFAETGIPVVLIDSDPAAIERGINTIESQLADRVKRGRLSESASEKIRGLISSSTDSAALSDADIVIEAIIENFAIKQQVLENAITITKPGAVVATNTSYLDIEALAAATSRPQDVIGMHFFHPARVMKLVEVIPTTHTSPETIATVAQLTRRFKKIGVRSGPEEGFIGNKIYSAYRDQCEQLLVEGATPSQVDDAMKAFGFAMGLFAVGDSSGLDIAWARRKALRAAGQLSDEPTVADRLCEMGRLGVKTGAGFYKYTEGSRAGAADPEVEAIIEELSKERGIARRTFTETEIQEANMAAIVSEAANVVSRGTAASGRSIDIVELNGFGFPNKKGGPVFWARHQPREHLLQVVKSTADAAGRDVDMEAVVRLLEEEPAEASRWTTTRFV